MNKSPILIIDDDPDDLELIQQAAVELNLGRDVMVFSNGNDLIHQLHIGADSPFFILCDMRLAGEDGLQLKRRISDDDDLKYKGVPFIYWSTTASEKQIQSAYDCFAQGFFFKPVNFTDLCDTIQVIVNYWQKSKHPKRFE